MLVDLRLWDRSATGGPLGTGTSMPVPSQPPESRTLRALMPSHASLRAGIRTRVFPLSHLFLLCCSLSRSSLRTQISRRCLAFPPHALDLSLATLTRSLTHRHARCAASPALQTMRDVSWYKDGPSISFPLRPSTVTEADVAVLALGVPLTVFGAVGYWKQDRAGTALAALALAETLSMSLSITVVGKKAAGSLRPCFIAMCEWDNKTETCGAPRAVALDARQSFPSGHSSTCGAALGLLSLFLNHHVCLLTAPSPLRPKTGILGPLLRPLAWLPLLGAFLVGVSRFLDNHHRSRPRPASLTRGHVKLRVARTALGRQIESCVYGTAHPPLFLFQARGHRGRPRDRGRERGVCLRLALPPVVGRRGGARLAAARGRGRRGAIYGGAIYGRGRAATPAARRAARARGRRRRPLPTSVGRGGAEAGPGRERVRASRVALHYLLHTLCCTLFVLHLHPVAGGVSSGAALGSV